MLSVFYFRLQVPVGMRTLQVASEKPPKLCDMKQVLQFATYFILFFLLSTKETAFHPSIVISHPTASRIGLEGWRERRECGCS
jgi:hypothetical protein